MKDNLHKTIDNPDSCTICADATEVEKTKLQKRKRKMGVFQNRLNLVDTLPREQFSQLLFK